MSTQRDLFDRFREPLVEPISAPEEDRPRLEGQNAAILERLRRGPATNHELAAISLKYTARISDLRIKGGYDIPPPTRDRDSGTFVYRLSTPQGG